MANYRLLELRLKRAFDDLSEPAVDGGLGERLLSTIRSEASALARPGTASLEAALKASFRSAEPPEIDFDRARAEIRRVIGAGSAAASAAESTVAGRFRAALAAQPLPQISEQAVERLLRAIRLQEADDDEIFWGRVWRAATLLAPCCAMLLLYSLAISRTAMTTPEYPLAALFEVGEGL